MLGVEDLLFHAAHSARACWGFGCFSCDNIVDA